VNSRIISIITTLLLWASVTSVEAREPQGGRESLFSIGAGARALGMGGAFTAVSDDVTARPACTIIHQVSTGYRLLER
jgi:hypothetical protein